MLVLSVLQLLFLSEARNNTPGGDYSSMDCPDLLRSLLIVTDEEDLFEAVCGLSLTDIVNLLPVAWPRFKATQLAETVVTSELDDVLREANITEAQAKDAVDAIRNVLEDEMPGLKPHFQAVVDIITTSFANTTDPKVKLCQFSLTIYDICNLNPGACGKGLSRNDVAMTE